MTDVDYQALSFVTTSKYRRQALEELESGPKTPTEVTDRLDHDGLSHISRALTQLRESDLVELLVEEDTKKGRFYGLTGEGEEILETLRDREPQRGESPA